MGTLVARQADITAQVRRIVGAENALTRRYWKEVPTASRDGSHVTVAYASSAEEISTILTFANRERIPVYARQGTGYLSQEITRPIRPGSIVVDLRRMKRIVVAKESRFVEVEAAVTQRELNDSLRGTGFEFPTWIPAVSWGGLVSMNISGFGVDIGVGKPGDYVLGLRVVLPTGEIVETGTTSLRRPSGIDLTRLFIGNQGLLGVIALVRLRLVAAPPYRAHGIAVFTDNVGVARAAAGYLRSSLPVPRVLEHMDPRFGTRASWFPSTPMLLVEAVGETQEEATRGLEQVLGFASSQGARSSRRLSAQEWDELWGARASSEPKEIAFDGRHYPFTVDALDPPLDRLEEAMASIEELQGEFATKYPGLVTFVVFHAGGPTIHPILAYPTEWSDSKRAVIAAEAKAAFTRLKLALRATTGDGGVPFPQYAMWFEEMYGDTQLELIRRIKAAFDPNGVLNTQKLSQARR